MHRERPRFPDPIQKSVSDRMKHESFDEREIYIEGVLDGLALAMDYPKNITELRDVVASIKARQHWKFTLEEMELSPEPRKGVEDL